MYNFAGMKRGPKIDPLLGGLARHTVLLDELSVVQLRALGGGNLSHGIRLSARVAFDRYQATPDRDSPPTDVPGALPAAPLPP